MITSLQIECLPARITFNVAAQHCGLRRFDDVAVRNAGRHLVEPTLLSVRWSALARPHALALPRLDAGQTAAVGDRILPLLDLDALRRQRESRAVVWEVGVAKTLLHRCEVRVQAFNEWSWQRGDEVTLAAFVQPNARAVAEVVSSSRSLLAARTGFATFQEARERGGDAAEAGGRARAWSEMAGAIYDGLRLRYGWAYAWEPPSFESDSQKLRLADEVRQDQEGTCVDLAALFAGCLERVHLSPLVVVLRRGDEQHALAGWWTKKADGAAPVVRTKAELLARVTEGALALVECTGFAQGASAGNAEFAPACAAATDALRSWDLWAAIDVGEARRRLGITPLAAEAADEAHTLGPFFARQGWPVLGSWLSDGATSAWGRALREAVGGGGGELTTRHLLLGLLSLPDSVTERVVTQLGRDAAWLRGKVLSAVRRGAGGPPRPVVPSEALRGILERLYAGVAGRGVQAGEAETLRAVAQAEGATTRELYRALGCDPAALTAAIDEVGRAGRVWTASGE